MFFSVPIRLTSPVRSWDRSVMHARVYEFKGTKVIEIMGDRMRGEVELSVGLRRICREV